LQLDVILEPHPRDHLILLLDLIDMLFLAFENVFEQLAREIPYWGDAKRFYCARDPQPRLDLSDAWLSSLFSFGLSP